MGLRILPLLGLLATLPLRLGAAAIVNGGFESGDTSGWTVTSGTGGFGTGQAATVVPAGPAPNTAGNLDRVYNGTYACELNSGSGDVAHADWIRLSQTILVDPTDTLLRFRYAAVLNGTHSSYPPDDAYVEVKVTSSLGGTISDNTYAYASSPAPLVNDGVTSFRHLPWTLLYVDLTPYAGQNVTVEFTAYDCAQAGHNALAYVDGFELVPPTPTITVTYTSTVTPTVTPTATPTSTSTDTPTSTVTTTPSATPTVTPTFTISPTFTLTPRPLVLKLLPPSPNPAGDAAWLPWFIATDADVEIRVYDVSGEKVRDFPPVFHYEGYHETYWDLKNDSGANVASGTYIWRVTAVSRRRESEVAFSKVAVSR